MVELKRCSKIFSGYHFKKAIEVSEQSEYKVIQVKNILSNGKIDWESLESVDMDTMEIDKFLLEPGDLIINAKGLRRSVALLGSDLPQQYKFFTTSNFFVIRPSSDLNPEFLHWWLMQKPVQTFLEEESLGLKTPNIKRKSIESICIPVITAAKQRAVADIYRNQLEQLALLNSITEKHLQINSALADELYRGKNND